MATNIGISITPEEETLIKVVSIPQGPIEWTWLNNTVHIISGKSSINFCYCYYCDFSTIFCLFNVNCIHLIYIS